MITWSTRQRRQRAEVVINTYCEFMAGAHGQDEALIDILTDLRHWSEHIGIDFAHALEHAASHFETEVEP